MSLRTLVGPRPQFLGDSIDEQLVELRSPVLTRDQFRALVAMPQLYVATIPLVFPSGAGERGPKGADQHRAVCGPRCRVRRPVDRSERPRGHEGLAPIPPLLATSAVHHGLIARSLRMSASLIVETGEARDAHQVATLLAYGASAVCPFLGYAIVESLTGSTSVDSAGLYRSALEEGLLKIFSKMGISTAGGYCGGQLFDVIGLDQTLVDWYFPGTRSPLGGATMPILPVRCWPDTPRLSRIRRLRSAIRGFTATAVTANTTPITPRSYGSSTGQRRREVRRVYDQFAQMVYARPPTALRDLLEFTPRPAGYPG